MEPLYGLSATFGRILWNTSLWCEISCSRSDLSASKIKISTKGTNLFFFIHCIVIEVISLTWGLFILQWRSTGPSTSTDRWFHIGTSSWHCKEITTSNRWFLCFLCWKTGNTCSRDSKLHCNILLSLCLKCFLYVLVNSLFLTSDTIWLHLRCSKTNFIPETYFLFTEWTRIFQSKDVMEASFVHMVITIYQLQPGLSINDLCFTECTVNFWIVIVWLRWRMSLFETKCKESLKWYWSFLILQLQQ